MGTAARFLIFVAVGLATTQFAHSLHAELVSVSVDETNHFVVTSDGIELLGIQFESPSGSLVPLLDDARPFEFLLVNEPTMITIGSVESHVQISGSLRLPAKWDPNGERDVGFLWGSIDDDSWGLVEGHTNDEFLNDNANGVGASNVSENAFNSVPDSEPLEDGRDIQIDSPDATGTNAPFPSFVVLDPTRDVDQLYVHLFGNPGLQTLDVISAGGFLSLIDDPSLSEPTLEVVSSNSFAVTFSTPSSIADGDYPLPVRWSGTDYSDLEILGVANAGADLPIFEVDVNTAVAQLLPEPSSGVLFLLAGLVAVPAFRKPLY